MTSPTPLTGRELDALIHRAVFGLSPLGYGIGVFLDPNLPAYSSNPDATQKLVEKLMHDWGVVKTVSSDAPYFECEIVARDGSAAFVGRSETSLGEATCRAALSAVAQEAR